MEKYTFIAVYNGGIFCSQYNANDMQMALLQWGEGLQKKYFSAGFRKKILSDIQSDWYPEPIKMKDVDSVWAISYGYRGKEISLQIVLTA